MAKRKTTKRKPKQKKYFFSLKLLLFVLLILAIIPLSIGFYLFQTGEIVYIPKKEIKQKPIKDRSKKVEDSVLLDKMKSMLKAQKKEIAQELESLSKDENATKIIEPEIKSIKNFPSIDEALEEQKPTEAEDYMHSVKVSKKQDKPRKKRAYKGKPKLAIVIDDVSFDVQVKKIRAIPYKVTPSFLPPTNRHPNTPALAKGFSIYMVHVPMEAIRHAHPEFKTLKTGESFKSIDSWISKIHRQFPRAKYYNNHTGSRFTADVVSMDRFLKSLKSKNLKFLDSKTTSESKAKRVAKKYGMKILSRDVFLDNSFNVSAIKKQIRYAVRVAKNHGYAIAICHPHKTTLKVLKEAKPLLKGVELVYINEI